MNNNIKITTRLNLLLVLYTAGVFVFQPLAMIIQAGFLIYLSGKKIWRYFIYGTVLFLCFIATNFAYTNYSTPEHKDFYIMALGASVFANLFWFTAMIKYLKVLFYVDEE